MLADTVLGAGRLTVSEFARRLGVSRVALSRVVNGRAAIDDTNGAPDWYLLDLANADGLGAVNPLSARFHTKSRWSGAPAHAEIHA